ADRETFAYAPEKWTIRQVLGHLADAERVFGYRALCLSRGETSALPSFDEDEYARQSPARDQPLADLAEEFRLARAANLSALRPLSEDAWRKIGIASKMPVSARGIAYVMAGHVRHHLRIL